MSISLVGECNSDKEITDIEIDYEGEEVFTIDEEIGINISRYNIIRIASVDKNKRDYVIFFKVKVIRFLIILNNRFIVKYLSSIYYNKIFRTLYYY